MSRITTADLAASLYGSPEFAAWWKNCLRSVAGKDALNDFESARVCLSNSDDADAAATLARMAGACFKAAAYDRERDPSDAYRADARTSRQRAPELAAAADELQRGFAGKHPGLDWALAEAVQQSGIKGPGRGEPLAKVYSAFFGALRDALRRPLPGAHGGPFMGRFRVGNLLSDRPIAAGRPVDTASMLTFELAVYVRMWAGGQAQHWIQQEGERMPQVAMPRGGWNLCASWVNAALVNTTPPPCLTGDLARVRVRDLGDAVSLMDWPQRKTRSK